MMQEVKQVSFRNRLPGTEDLIEDEIQELQEKIKQLNEEGWTIVSIIPVSYSPVSLGAAQRLILSEVALLCTR